MDELFTEIWYKLADGKRICLKVPIEVKDLINETDRQIRSQRRQDRRRHTEYVEGLTDSETILRQEDVADLVCRMDSYERLYAAIEKLSDIQRRRVILYYFNGFTYRRIAEHEGIGHTKVARSVERALAKLRRILSD